MKKQAKQKSARNLRREKELLIKKMLKTGAKGKLYAGSVSVDGSCFTAPELILARVLLDTDPVAMSLLALDSGLREYVYKIYVDMSEREQEIFNRYGRKFSRVGEADQEAAIDELAYQARSELQKLDLRRARREKREALNQRANELFDQALAKRKAEAEQAEAALALAKQQELEATAALLKTLAAEGHNAESEAAAFEQLATAHAEYQKLLLPAAPVQQEMVEEEVEEIVAPSARRPVSKRNLIVYDEQDLELANLRRFSQLFFAEATGLFEVRFQYGGWEANENDPEAKGSGCIATVLPEHLGVLKALLKRRDDITIEVVVSPWKSDPDALPLLVGLTVWLGDNAEILIS